MNTNLDKIEEILSQTIREHKTEDIIPDRAIKNKLDKAFANKRRKNSVFSIRIPLYQSVAAAVIFFILGFSSNLLRPASPPEVVKYVDRPVAEIRYVKAPVVQKNVIRDTIIAQDMSQKNINKNLSISLKDDTVLQKMLLMLH